ncbi:hypothetical protein BV22DRAFT_989449, partial [Leucogyrophana mollusca]
AKAQVLIKAHEFTEETREAQLIIQHAYLDKLNQSLYAKENKQKDDRTKLFPKGFGRHLTSEEFVGELEAQETAKQHREDEKRRRKETQRSKKAAKGALDALWKKMQDEHTVALTAWEAECGKLRAEGMLVKDLPKRPKRPTK